MYRFRRDIFNLRFWLATLLAFAGSGSVRAQHKSYTIPAVSDQQTNPICLVATEGGPESFLKATLRNVPEGYLLTNGIYTGWCVDYDTLIASETVYKPIIYSSLSPLPQRLQSTNWSRINYILNHKLGNGIDVQNALWHFIGGPVPIDDPVYYPPSAAAQQMIEEADAHGAGFEPSVGNVTAIILDLGPEIQTTIIEARPKPICLVAVDGNPECFLKATLSEVPANALITNGTYCGWCVDYDVLIAEGVLYKPLFFSSQEPLPQRLQSEHWDMINYILNHKQGTAVDVQNALWHFIGGPVPPGDPVYYPASAIASNLIAEAMAHGEGFTPGPGQIIAVILDLGSSIQTTIVEVLLPISIPSEDRSSERPASVGDFVWEDLNHNGVQDALEPGIAGVVVQLLQNDQIVATTSTGGSGEYLFTGVPPGNYALRFIAPGGYYFTSLHQGLNSGQDSDANNLGVTSAFMLTSGQSDLTHDAGLFRLGAIGDLVWRDSNNDGVHNDNESGAANVPVQLMDCGSNVLATTTTDANGSYLFINVAPGDYRIAFSAPAGSYFTSLHQGDSIENDSDAEPASGLTDCLRIVSGQTNRTVDAGLSQWGEVSDFVFHDLNGNGAPDPGEPGISGMAVQLSSPLNSVISTALSSGDGSVTFRNLKPGNYKMVCLAPNGFKFNLRHRLNGGSINPGNGDTNAFSLLAGERKVMANESLIKLCAIGGRVWNDANANGVQTPNEPGISNITVRLLDCDDTILGLTNTSANGSYLFVNLLPGGYRIAVMPGTGFTFTSADVGNDSQDSDIVQATGMTACIALNSGVTNRTVDAGLKRKLRLTTYTAPDWAAFSKSNANENMLKYFLTFAGRGGLVIGGKNRISFNSAKAIEGFLLSNSAPGILKHSYLNPLDTEAGNLAVQTVVLKLNVDFSNAGYLPRGLATAKIAPGNKLAFYSVSQVLTLANRVVGGQLNLLPKACSVSDLEQIIEQINSNFDKGTRDAGFCTP